MCVDLTSQTLPLTTQGRRRTGRTGQLMLTVIALCVLFGACDAGDVAPREPAAGETARSEAARRAVYGELVRRERDANAIAQAEYPLDVRCDPYSAGNFPAMIELSDRLIAQFRAELAAAMGLTDNELCSDRSKDALNWPRNAADQALLGRSIA